eukprot:scaffold219502_cov21-Prasinocladus_malaysianus.AAC.1
MVEVVRYAMARGIRVIPEFDVPGHGSWGKSHPELMGCMVEGRQGDTAPTGVLDPTNPAVYDFLATFLKVQSLDEQTFLIGAILSGNSETET